MQMICALLIFQTEDLPGTLPELSPWLDRRLMSRDERFARLAAQQHRRFIKTHTPLDGIPIDPRATYIVVARHPLDMAVSLYHQGSNIDRARLRQLTGQSEPSEPPLPRPPLHDWARRGQPNIALVHYQDLSADLDGEMRRLAGRLQISVPEEIWPGLVRAATFQYMRDNSERLTGPPAIIKDSKAFFRRGTSGAGREELSAAELADYQRRVAQLAPPDGSGMAYDEADLHRIAGTGDGGRPAGLAESTLWRLIRRTARYPLTGSRRAGSPSLTTGAAGSASAPVVTLTSPPSSCCSPRSAAVPRSTWTS